MGGGFHWGCINERSQGHYLNKLLRRIVIKKITGNMHEERNRVPVLINYRAILSFRSEITCNDKLGDITFYGGVIAKTWQVGRTGRR